MLTGGPKLSAGPMLGRQRHRPRRWHSGLFLKPSGPALPPLRRVNGLCLQPSALKRGRFLSIFSTGPLSRATWTLTLTPYGLWARRPAWPCTSHRCFLTASYTTPCYTLQRGGSGPGVCPFKRWCSCCGEKKKKDGIFKKFKMELPYHSVIPLIGIYSPSPTEKNK